jgi:hypothetical protein
LIKIKATPPDIFDGTTAKLRDFIRQMETYFFLQSANFTTESSKILTLFQFCRGGSAGEWARHHTEQYIAALQGENFISSDVVFTWEELKEKMKYRFGDQYERETAVAKIKRAFQGSKKVKQYIEEFVQLIPQADLPEDQLCEYLVGGVNNELWDIIKNEYLPRSDFNKLCLVLEKAEKNYVRREITADNRRRQQAAIRNKFPEQQKGTYFQHTRQEVTRTPQQSSQPSRPQNTQSRPPQPPREKPLPPGEPMDIDRIRRNQERRCFKCRQPGHFARDCPVKDIRELREEQIYEIAAAHLSGSPEEEENTPFEHPYAPQEEETNPDTPNVILDETTDF